MKRVNLWITLFVVCLGGFIGFDPNSPSQTLDASQTMIRWVDVLGLNSKSININLKDETVSVDGDVDNTSVTITRDVETLPEFKTKVIEKVIYLPEDITSRTKFFNRLMPINKTLPVKNW